jgi:hypothetical protein
MTAYGGEGTALLILNFGINIGVRVQRHSTAALFPGKEPPISIEYVCWMGPRAGLGSLKKKSLPVPGIELIPL